MRRYTTRCHSILKATSSALLLVGGLCLSVDAHAGSWASKPWYYASGSMGYTGATTVNWPTSSSGMFTQTLTVNYTGTSGSFFNSGTVYATVEWIPSFSGDVPGAGYGPNLDVSAENDDYVALSNCYVAPAQFPNPDPNVSDIFNDAAYIDSLGKHSNSAHIYSNLTIQYGALHDGTMGYYVRTPTFTTYAKGTQTSGTGMHGQCQVHISVAISAPGP